MILRINISEIVGSGYREYWFSKKRYCVVKGGRGSKKSKTTALWIVYNMMKYPLANTLVVRQVYKDNRDSTLKDLEWAAWRLGVHHLWKFNINPMEITYLPTGQKILFRGLNDSMSLTSITVSHGYLCWCWIEECYQVKSEDDFNKLDMSIRGLLPDGYFKRFMITFNPWNENHWLKRRFFDKPDDNTLALTTTYKCNEWLGADDIKLFEDMKQKYPRRYSVEGCGNWGISEGLIFAENENWIEQEFDYTQIDGTLCVGVDWGFIDPTSIIQSILVEETKTIYVFSEWYKNNVITEQVYNALIKLGLQKATIIADSARPEQIEEIRRKGIRNIRACTKGKDSIINGINKLLEYKIVVHPDCKHLIAEFQNYSWDKDKNGNTIEKPIDDWCHSIDSLRYSLQCLKTNKLKSFDKAALGL